MSKYNSIYYLDRIVNIPQPGQLLYYVSLFFLRLPFRNGILSHGGSKVYLGYSSHPVAFQLLQRLQDTYHMMVAVRKLLAPLWLLILFIRFSRVLSNYKDGFRADSRLSDSSIHNLAVFLHFCGCIVRYCKNLVRRFVRSNLRLIPLLIGILRVCSSHLRFLFRIVRVCRNGCSIVLYRRRRVKFKRFKHLEICQKYKRRLFMGVGVGAYSAFMRARYRNDIHRNVRIVDKVVPHVTKRLHGFDILKKCISVGSKLQTYTKSGSESANILFLRYLYGLRFPKLFGFTDSLDPLFNQWYYRSVRLFNILDYLMGSALFFLKEKAISLLSTLSCRGYNYNSLITQDRVSYNISHYYSKVCLMLFWISCAEYSEDRSQYLRNWHFVFDYNHVLFSSQCGAKKCRRTQVFSLRRVKGLLVYRLLVKATRSNCFANLIVNGRTLVSLSCGKIGFRKTHRSTFFAAKQLGYFISALVNVVWRRFFLKNASKQARNMRRRKVVRLLRSTQFNLRSLVGVRRQLPGKVLRSTINKCNRSIRVSQVLHMDSFLGDLTTFVTKGRVLSQRSRYSSVISRVFINNRRYFKRRHGLFRRARRRFLRISLFGHGVGLKALYWPLYNCADMLQNNRKYFGYFSKPYRKNPPASGLCRFVPLVSFFNYGRSKMARLISPRKMRMFGFYGVRRRLFGRKDKGIRKRLCFKCDNYISHAAWDTLGSIEWNMYTARLRRYRDLWYHTSKSVLDCLATRSARFGKRSANYKLNLARLKLYRKNFGFKLHERLRQFKREKYLKLLKLHKFEKFVRGDNVRFIRSMWGNECKHRQSKLSMQWSKFRSRRFYQSILLDKRRFKRKRQTYCGSMVTFRQFRRRNQFKLRQFQHRKFEYGNRFKLKMCKRTGKLKVGQFKRSRQFRFIDFPFGQLRRERRRDLVGQLKAKLGRFTLTRNRLMQLEFRQLKSIEQLRKQLRRISRFNFVNWSRFRLGLFNLRQFKWNQRAIKRFEFEKQFRLRRSKMRQRNLARFREQLVFGKQFKTRRQSKLRQFKLRKQSRLRQFRRQNRFSSRLFRRNKRAKLELPSVEQGAVRLRLFKRNQLPFKLGLLRRFRRNQSQRACNQFKFGLFKKGYAKFYSFIRRNNRFMYKNMRFMQRNVKFVQRRNRKFMQKYVKFMQENGRFMQENGRFIQGNRKFMQRIRKFMQQRMKFMQEIGRFMPRNWRFMPKNGGFIPRNGRFIPKNGEFMPRNVRFMSKNGRFMPKNGRFMPRNGRFMLRNGGFMPKNRRFMPRNRKSMPKNRRFIHGHRRPQCQLVTLRSARKNRSRLKSHLSRKPFRTLTTVRHEMLRCPTYRLQQTTGSFKIALGRKRRHRYIKYVQTCRRFIFSAVVSIRRILYDYNLYFCSLNLLSSTLSLRILFQSRCSVVYKLVLGAMLYYSFGLHFSLMPIVCSFNKSIFVLQSGCYIQYNGAVSFIYLIVRLSVSMQSMLEYFNLLCASRNVYGSKYYLTYARLLSISFIGFLYRYRLLVSKIHTFGIPFVRLLVPVLAYFIGGWSGSTSSLRLLQLNFVLRFIVFNYVGVRQVLRKFLIYLFSKMDSLTSLSYAKRGFMHVGVNRWAVLMRHSRVHFVIFNREKRAIPHNGCRTSKLRRK